MSDIGYRLFWFAFFMCAFAYICYLFIGSIFDGQYKSHIVIQDDVKPGQHFISGMVNVPSPCHQVSVGSVYMGSSTYAINLQTWQEPSAKCGSAETPRSFATVIHAPAYGTQFTVFLNGVAQPVEFVAPPMNVQ